MHLTDIDDSEYPVPSDPEPADVIFAILKDPQRRHILEYLDRDAAVTLAELADHLAARENGKDADEVTPDERKSASMALSRTHLSFLEAASVLDVDHETELIEPGLEAAKVWAYLHSFPEDSPLSREAAFKVLGNPVRRRVLEYLEQHDWADLADVGEHVAAWQHGKDGDQLTDDERTGWLSAREKFGSLTGQTPVTGELCRRPLSST